MTQFLIILGSINALILITAFIINEVGMEKGIQLTAIIITALATVSLAFFGWVQMRETNRLHAVQRTSEWGGLRNAMWEIMDQYPPSGVDDLKSLSVSEATAWFKKIRNILDSQIGNPVLIENEYELGCWRNAISTARTVPAILEAKPDTYSDDVVRYASSIDGDVMRVWSELVLNSKQVSATGGRPKKEK